MSAEAEKVDLILAGFTADSPLDKLSDKFDLLASKIDAKIAETNGEPEGTNQTWITRWSNALIKLSGWIKAKQASTTTSTESTKSKVTGESNFNKSKLMTADVNSQPTLSPALNVEVFVRHMDTVYTSHVANQKSLESTFCLNVETKLCSDYRTTYQEHCAGTLIEDWTSMRSYLLDRHQSTSTCFQELHNATSPRIKQGQELRDFVAHVATNGKERLTVIKARYKKDNDKDITVDALFELMLGQTVLKAMQESPSHQRHYHHIAPDLDQCYELDKLAKKADRLMEREVNLGATNGTTTETFMTGVSQPSVANEISRLQGQVQALLAGQRQGQQQSPGQSSQQSGRQQKQTSEYKKKSFKELLKDPEWCKKMSSKDCRWGLNCRNRDVCPCKHPASQSQQSSSQPPAGHQLSGQSNQPINLYAEREGFRRRVQ